MTNLIGQIKCIEVIDQFDGTYRVIFDCDDKFKSEYKKIFGLKKWSIKHFEKKLEEAIKQYIKQSQTNGKI